MSYGPHDYGTDDELNAIVFVGFGGADSTVSGRSSVRECKSRGWRGLDPSTVGATTSHSVLLAIKFVCISRHQETLANDAGNVISSSAVKGNLRGDKQFDQVFFAVVIATHSLA